jgi:demethylmenaquinone methyltransferase/2-methoxy-6-polyprenyl-1,4-benzoquinol methylase
VKTDPDSGRAGDVLRVFTSRSQTKAFYNKISRAYDLLSDRSEAPMRKAGLRLLNAASGERVLEIGFGTGLCLADLARAIGATGEVFGLDLSDQMVEMARKKLARARLLDRCNLRCGDAARLPYKDGSLGAVFMSFVLELFDTPEIPGILGECKRVLRPDGRIVVVGMSKERPKNRMVRIFEWTHRHFPNFLDCRPIYVRRALQEAGFRIEKALQRRMWVPVEIVLALNRLQT